jgi:hypothetical protein
MTVVGLEGQASPGAAPGGASSPGNGPAVEAAPADARETDLRNRALSDSGVQAMLDVFAAEITKIEEI